MLFRPEPACVIPQRDSAAIAALFGRLCTEDTRRALRVEYAHVDPVERAHRIARDVDAAVTLAQRAWCAALEATGYRETACHCLIGGGHR
jgi:hypothetical protein